ncbi:MAG: trypsin-like peptidase domain-containing protein [Planctomycetes bacterium]|nr:trypsin-like peptidase domain-containing protein [Planctomycetota bacterium]MCB9824593.1 trypsin-like peptidase domain-containing protein [Planctomycetota bacterium]MCB9899995.1 trypsin-like peptidase domain-containing protein [Planctomycetota bacterium]
MNTPHHGQRPRRVVSLMAVLLLAGGSLRATGSRAHAGPDPVAVAGDSAPLPEGIGPTHRLSRRAPHERFTFEVGAEATRFDLVVAATELHADVDVYLRRGRPFGIDPRREADVTARTTSGLEHAKVEGPLAPGRWFVWIELDSTSHASDVQTFLRVAPGAYADVVLPRAAAELRELRVGATRWAGRLLVAHPLDSNLDSSFAELRVDGELPLGLMAEEDEDGHVRRPPAGLGKFNLQIEVRSGADEPLAAMPVFQGGGAKSFSHLEVDEPRTLELLSWSIPRPVDPSTGEPADDANATLRLEAPFGSGNDVRHVGFRGPKDMLQGVVATHVLLSGASDMDDVAFDVPASARSVRVTARPEEDVDVDLYLSAGKPGDERTVDADWYAISLQPNEIVVAGGEGELPAGTWYLTTELIDDVEDVRVQLEMSWSDEPVEDVRAASLPRGTFLRGHVEPDSAPTAWYRVDVPEGATSLGAQVWKSTGALDLMLVRPDDGSILARSFSPRPDERMVWSWGSPLAAARSVWLGVTSPDPYEDPIDFEVAWDVQRTPMPELPNGWPPPGRRRSGQPLPRSQAACVEITLDDGSGGSGACLTADGYILTCRHVLQPEDDGPLQDEGILVAFPVRTDRPPVHAFEARLLDSDEDLDLALLKIERDVFGRPLDPKRPLPFIELGDPDALELGAPVTIYGYPADGSERNRTPLTLSRGVVSGLEADAAGRLRWIKTDAWVGPGHSGGLLTDSEGRLLGVPAATLGDLEVLGLAVPLSMLPAAWRARLR